MIPSIRELYCRFDAERRQAVRRRMRSRPTSVAGVARQMEADGEAWIAELGAARGDLTAADILVLVEILRGDTVPQLAAFAMAAGLPLDKVIEMSLGAGLGVGLMIGWDRATADAESRAA